MAKIPGFDPINDAIDRITVPPSKREYLGYSSLGGECERHIWYSFRWCAPYLIPARIQRIFERGHLEEERVIKSLESIGCTITDEQKEVETLEGHVKGHIDGLIIGLPQAEKTLHLLEIKTANDRSFKGFLKNGVKKQNLSYYRQMQCYMHHLNLERGLFVVVNKNDESYYFERIYRDREEYDFVDHRAFKILSLEDPPAQIGNATYFKCKMCSSRSICHKNEPIQINCRTCKHSCIDVEGTWTCELTEEILTKQDQINGCKKYTKLW